MFSSADENPAAPVVTFIMSLSRVGRPPELWWFVNQMISRVYARLLDDNPYRATLRPRGGSFRELENGVGPGEMRVKPPARRESATNEWHQKLKQTA